MSNNPQAVDTFYRAQSLAYWSYTGLLIPLVGVILGAMARSRLRMLSGADEDEQYEIDRVRRIAGWGFGLSLFFLVVQVIGLLVWGASIGIAAAKVSQGQ